MINIFYNKTTLNNTMIISVSMQKPNTIKKHNDEFVLLYNDDKLVGINIFQFNKFLNLQEGMIYPTDEVLKVILKITKIDLSNYVEKNFVIGEIVNFEKIPNTHLNYCDVNIGSKTLKIVCGAGNVKKNLKAVVAMPNTFIPTGKPIVKSSIQGKESFGMMCSAQELNIKMKDGTKGIIELDNSYQIGDLFEKAFANY